MANSTAKKKKPFVVRWDPADLGLVRLASALSGRSMVGIVRESATEAAQRIIDEHTKDNEQSA